MKPLYIIAAASVTNINEKEWLEGIPVAQRRRTPRIWQIALAVTAALFKKTELRPRSVLAATALGALDETKDFIDGVFRQNSGAPRNFIASVHNSIAGRIAVEYAIHGPNITVCDGQNSFAAAIGSASLLESTNLPALLICIDEQIPLLNDLSPHLSSICGSTIRPDSIDGAVAFLLDAAGTPDQPQLTAAGPSPCNGRQPSEIWNHLSAGSGSVPTLTVPSKSEVISFLLPALATAEFINSGEKGISVFGSYSPSADAASIVSICV